MSPGFINIAYLSQCSHHQETQESHESIAYEEGCGSSLSERFPTECSSADHGRSLSCEEETNSRSNNKTCSNCTSDGDHSNLSGLQSAMKMVMNIFIIKISGSDVDFVWAALLLAVPKLVGRLVVMIDSRHGGNIFDQRIDRNLVHKAD
jgi:hypothetical protein